MIGSLYCEPSEPFHISLDFAAQPSIGALVAVVEANHAAWSSKTGGLGQCKAPDYPALLKETPNDHHFQAQQFFVQIQIRYRTGDAAAQTWRDD